MRDFSKRHRRMQRLLAAIAVSDVAYRLFVRAPLRRTLGIETQT